MKKMYYKKIRAQQSEPHKHVAQNAASVVSNFLRFLLKWMRSSKEEKKTLWHFGVCKPGAESWSMNATCKDTKIKTQKVYQTIAGTHLSFASPGGFQIFHPPKYAVESCRATLTTSGVSECVHTVFCDVFLFKAIGTGQVRLVKQRMAL